MKGKKADEYNRLSRALARSLLYAFVQYMKPDYSMGWVHELICDSLDSFLLKVLDKKSPRLMITMPPRSGKTELVSRCFPAYVLGKFPDMNVIAASYSADLASRTNRDVQRIIDTPEYRALFPQTKLTGKGTKEANVNYLRNSDIFEIVGRKGSYRSAGQQGSLTGMGAEILICDDPIKSKEVAYSSTERGKVWDWYLSTFYTRQSPGAGILLIQTRWHMDDLAGRLLAGSKTGEGEEWKLLNFPAIAEEDELHRKKGEPLHPKRFSLEAYEAIKKVQGKIHWAALYQQRPTPTEGAIFMRDRFKYYQVRPERFDRILLSWDMTFKDTAGTDYVVGQVWGQLGGQAYLLDQVRDKLGFVATCEAFIRQVDKWPEAIEKLVEDKANGPAVIDYLKQEIPGIIPVEPDGSKVARAHAVTPLFEAGNVFFPAEALAPWVVELEQELLHFPSDAHDDQVDALTQALRRMFKHQPMEVNPAILDKLAAQRRQAVFRGLRR